MICNSQNINIPKSIQIQAGYSFFSLQNSKNAPQTSRCKESPSVRQSKAKNQQKCKCKQGLFTKAYEYSMYCDADVYVVLRSWGNGHIFSFTSDDGWSPSMRELMCPRCCLQKPEILIKEGTPLSSAVEADLKRLQMNYELSCFWSTK